MAANLDKSENSLTSVSTLTYLRGIDASGNSVKISTSDLASVLGVNITKNIQDTRVYKILYPLAYRSGIFELKYTQNDVNNAIIDITVFVGRFNSVRYIKIINRTGTFPNERFSLYYDDNACIYVRINRGGSGNIIAVNSTNEVVVSNVSVDTLTKITGDVNSIT